MKRHILKFTSILLVLFFSLVLVSCGDTDDEEFSDPVFSDLEPITLSLPGDHATSVNPSTAYFEYSAPSDATFLRLFIFTSTITTSGHNFTNTGDLVAGNDTDKEMGRNQVTLDEMRTFTGTDFTTDFTWSGSTQYFWTIVGYNSEGYPVASSPERDFTTN